MDKKPFLLVGGTAALGRKVVSELLNRDRRVRMLVRDPVKAEEFARRGVELVHGHMMDPPSLIAAIDG
jgi:NAD(P)H dehydrogenase (quinone)